MGEKRKAALILEEWIDQLEGLKPASYKAVFSALCRFRISGEEPKGDFSAEQKAILGLLIRESKLMDESTERVRKWREKKNEEQQQHNSNVTPTLQQHNTNVVEVEEEGEKEEEGETLSSESVCAAAPAAPPPTIDAEEKKKLIADGIPAAYVDYFCDVCEAKGYKYNRPTSACRAWWKKDKNRQEWQQPSGQSFDTNEFFDAALRKSIGDNENT